jgi:hypothetical protein
VPKNEELKMKKETLKKSMREEMITSSINKTLSFQNSPILIVDDDSFNVYSL